MLQEGSDPLGSLDFARDFGSGLGRPLGASTSTSQRDSQANRAAALRMTNQTDLPISLCHFGQVQVKAGLRQQGSQLKGLEAVPGDLGVAIQAGFGLHRLSAPLQVVQELLSRPDASGAAGPQAEAACGRSKW